MKTQETEPRLTIAEKIKRMEAQSDAERIENLMSNLRNEVDAHVKAIKQREAYKAHANKLAEALRGLFTHCAMVHKYWGENCNQAEADAAIANATKAQHEYELAQ